MYTIAALNDRRISDLRSILETSHSLSFEETEEIIFRARTLLDKYPQVVGMEGLIKKINVFKDKELSPVSHETIFNHINELNLIYFFAITKKMPVGIERKARTDNNKSIDLTISAQKTYYLEVKNLNRPKFTPKEFDFFNHLKERLRQCEIKEPFLVHMNILDDKRLDFKNSHLDFILEKLEKAKSKASLQSNGHQLKFWFFPNKRSPIFSLAFAYNSEMAHLELYDSPLNSNRLDFSIKKRIIDGIKDTEKKFLDSHNEHINILAIPIGDYNFRNAVVDIQNWYFNEAPVSNPKKGQNGDLDPIVEHYDLYSKIIYFHKKRKIDVLVLIKGRGLLENYSWEVFSPDPAFSQEISSLFRT